MANARAAAQLGSYSDQIAASLATAGFTAPELDIQIVAVRLSGLSLLAYE